MSTSPKLILVALIAAAAAPSCGGNSNSQPFGTVTAAQACANRAQTSCTMRASCTNGDNIKRVYGSMDACIGRITLTCMDGLAAQNQGNTPALVQACANETPMLDCATILDNTPSGACAPTGPLPIGAACSFPGQCASGYCGSDKTATCGVCAAPPVPGDSCVTSACGYGQACVAATQVCEAYGHLDDACDSGTPCGTGFICVGASAASGTPGTCQAPIETAGAACGGTLPGCDTRMGLYCVGAAGAKTCVATTYAGDGMPCGPLTTSSYVTCLAGSCYTSTGVATSSDVGTCKADAFDGVACDVTLGPGCLSPARCVVTAGTAGVCVVPEDGMCS